ncbi:MAG: PQQ-dependent sugar dehydrogenase [Candidatus Andersenbacteria bacterium]
MTHVTKTWLTVLATAAVGTAAVVVLLVLARQQPSTNNAANSTSTVAPTASNVVVPPATTPPVPPASAPDTETVLTKLDIPWELAFLPDGSMLITERPGQLLLASNDRTSIPVSGVHHEGEGGLLGLALHPQFATNHQLYLYMTTAQADGSLRNRVERYRLDGTRLADRKVIVQGIPGAGAHDGGRLAFGPDGKLYVTTGDAGNEANAQDLSTLAGKILRLNDDGSIPSDNPFGTAVWSYGHRNVQGLTWDDQGRLWATEHGPSAAPPDGGRDEVNLIQKGLNYGWPVIRGDQTNDKMETPQANSGVDTTWAPSGMTFYKGSLLFAGLRGQSIYQAELSRAASIKIVPHLAEKFGRLRTIVLGPDGFFYILTNNTDGRGTPADDDDKLIRVHPRALGF